MSESRAPEPRFDLGTWCWHRDNAAHCQILEWREIWGAQICRAWMPATNTVARVHASELAALDCITPSVGRIFHASAAARLLDAIEDNLLMAPIQSSVVPLPHQLHALHRAMSKHRIRYLLADEVGLGKTIEAGLILRELKLRGMVRRILVVAPKGLVRQWQVEMQVHFAEKLQFVDPADLAASRPWRTDEDNLWRMHDQVICSLDSVKPLEGRRGWSIEQLNNYNRERFEDLVAAGWDLVIIDESHRMGGSTEQVARYKLGAALAAAVPYLLLLSATPHQGKTDQFVRLMQLLDRDAFPNESAVSRDRVGPYVIRTEKRSAIDADGNPLFKPRITRLHPVAWHGRHDAQQQLYDAITAYVRDGYNRSLAAKQRHIGFLMILMQRLVTSSTAAIRTTLERRAAVLELAQSPSAPHDSIDLDDWAELDGQGQLELAVQVVGWDQERAEVALLLELARETEALGTDTKAEALLELIYKLQQEEGDPSLKLLVFTEFCPTQSMLAGFLESRGFSVVLLNGSMDLEARSRAIQDFAGDARILVSTDAGGEGLNLQFCHVVVNFDMPWNPMRLEQRIGRVDRIGQHHVVRAVNFVLKDTVEHRVREVLEEKLALIAVEFGVDKASDVVDSVEADPLFDELFIQGLQNPAAIADKCEDVINQVREKIAGARRASELLTDVQDLKPDEARKWRDHPAQFWLERALTTGLPIQGGSAVRNGNAWRIKWTNGSESRQACFDARTAERNPELEWITLEDTRARAVIINMPRWIAGQPMPCVCLHGLPSAICGVWSLWAVGLTAVGVNRRRFLPVFVADDGRTFAPTAKRIWDLLLTEDLDVLSVVASDAASYWHEVSMRAAVTLGEPIFGGLLSDHRTKLSDERDRMISAFEARQQAIGRIGLPAVREHRLRRINAEHEARLEELDKGRAALPDLTAILMLRLGQPEEAGTPSSEVQES